MQEVVVEIIRLHLLEGLLVHPDGSLPGTVAEVRKLGGDVIAAARMTAQCDACRPFRRALQVCRRGVEVVDAVLEGVVHHLVHGLLVYHVLAGCILDHRPAHAAEAEQGYLVAIAGILADGHLFGGILLCLTGLGGAGGCGQA